MDASDPALDPGPSGEGEGGVSAEGGASPMPEVVPRPVVKITDADRLYMPTAPEGSWFLFWDKALAPYGVEPRNVEELPFDIDVSELREARYLFTPLKKLRTAPHIEAPRLTDGSYMFANCAELDFIPEIVAPHLSDIRGIFEGCVKLTDGNVTVKTGRESFRAYPISRIGSGSGLTKSPFVLL